MQSAAKRLAIREAWGGNLRSSRLGLHCTDLYFMISQPAPALDWHQSDMVHALEQEVLQNDDIVVLPGVEAYRNLTNKTLRTLQFMLSRYGCA